MIGAMSAYIKNIVGLIIMTALAEMVIPSGSLKKYIRFVMGLIIIASVTEPAVKLIWGRGYDFNLGIEDIYACGQGCPQEKQKELAESIYKEETEKICAETAYSMDMETEKISINTDGAGNVSALVYIKKPHICVTTAAGFDGGRNECGICTEESEKLRQALVLKTGIENIEVNVLED